MNHLDVGFSSNFKENADNVSPKVLTPGALCTHPLSKYGAPQCVQVVVFEGLNGLRAWVREQGLVPRDGARQTRAYSFPGVTTYFHSLFPQNAGHAMFDSLYPGFAGLVRFGLSRFRFRLFMEMDAGCSPDNGLMPGRNVWLRMPKLGAKSAGKWRGEGTGAAKKERRLVESGLSGKNGGPPGSPSTSFDIDQTVEKNAEPGTWNWNCLEPGTWERKLAEPGTAGSMSFDLEQVGMSPAGQAVVKNLFKNGDESASLLIGVDKTKQAEVVALVTKLMGRVTDRIVGANLVGIDGPNMPKKCSFKQNEDDRGEDLGMQSVNSERACCEVLKFWRHLHVDVVKSFFTNTRLRSSV